MKKEQFPPELDFFNSDLPALTARAEDASDAWVATMLHLVKMLTTETPIGSDEKKGARAHVTKLG